MTDQTGGGRQVRHRFFVFIWFVFLGTAMIILGIALHLAAFLFKGNRKLLPGLLTGYIDEKCARERHALWYEKLQRHT